MGSLGHSEPVHVEAGQRRHRDRRSDEPFNGFGNWSADEFLSGIFEVSDFHKPTAGQNGTVARNAFRGRVFAGFSLSLSKKFAMTYGVSTEVRLDGFNALNRVNLGDPTMDLNSASFGRSTFQPAPRALQFGVRLRP